ncbi:phenylalanyl-tRNA synthetase subunit beta [Chlamydia abortus]|nr:phenylalanyl-tRNA synthetase subunit beta [Chlamydia abortus]
MNVRTFSLIKPEENIFNPFNFTNTLVANDSKNYDHSYLRNSMIVSLNNVLVHNKKQNINNISIFEIGMINNMPNVLGIASNEKTFEEMKRDILSLTNKSLVFKKSNNIMFHKNVSEDIYLEDIYIGYLAKLNPNVLKSNAIFSEILLDKLTNKKHQYVPYNKNQLKSRDITFTLNKNESIEAKLNEINKLKGIYEISIKDVFEKDNNTKNVTISIVLES